jgi:hypothetical protein
VGGERRANFQSGRDAGGDRGKDLRIPALRSRLAGAICRLIFPVSSALIRVRSWSSSRHFELERDTCNDNQELNLLVAPKDKNLVPTQSAGFHLPQSTVLALRCDSGYIA